jgi:hypothetical protein
MSRPAELAECALQRTKPAYPGHSAAVHDECQTRRFARQARASIEPKNVFSRLHQEVSVLPKIVALVSTVLLLMSLGFSVLGSTPLLILKHDVAMDSRVIRQVFHYCYRLITVVAAVGSIAYGFAGRPLLSAGLASVAIIALLMHRWLLTRMDALRSTMHDGDSFALSRFRRLHIVAIAINATQLVAMGFATTQVSF